MINTKLMALLNKSKVYIAKNVISSWFSLIANVIAMFYIGNLLEKVLQNNFVMNDLIVTAVVIIIVIITRSVSNIYASKMAFLSSIEVQRTLREKIYAKLLSLGSNYNQKVTTSAAVQVAVEGIEQLEIYFSGYLPQLFYSILAPLSLFVILSFLSFKAALVLLICVPLIPLSIVAVQKFAKKLLNKYWDTYTTMGDSFLENIQGLTTLKIYERDAEKSDEMDIEAENFRKITMRVLTMQLNSISVMDIVAFGGAAIGTVVAISEFIKGNIGFQSTFVIIMLSSEFFIPLRLLGSFFHIAMNGMAASDKIFSILDINLEDNKSKILKDDIYSIIFDSVNYSYDKSRLILDDISFEIKKNSIVSFVGESGSGKSTIASLIMGINIDYHGDIFINNQQLSEISNVSLMENITLVSSQSYIFKGTVRKNLSMQNNLITDKMMIGVLKQVNLYKYLKSQNGLDTTLLEQGTNLSGGQSQRLALARAILKNSNTYIFDEITSNIDTESEEQIMKVIYELAKNKTVIIISHRLANVVNSDYIYTLSKGKIVEFGSHDTLIKNNSLYKELYSNQEILEEYTKKKEIVYA